MNTRQQIPVKASAAPVPQRFTPAPFATLQRKCGCGASASAAGGCDECNKKKKTLQRSTARGAQPITAKLPVPEFSGSTGQALDHQARTYPAPRYGHDFRRVRVHTGPKAEESAKAGNAAADSGGNVLMMQAKLEINRAGDFYEQQADRAADQVMRMANVPEGVRAEDHARSTPASAPVVQRAGSPMASGVTAPPIVDEALRSPGQPLPASVQDYFRPRFGHDFSAVRVHTDPQAAKSAQAVEARAYTVGNDLVFAPGQYVPGTATGQHLIAHELAHVIQQGAAPPVANSGDSSPARAAVAPSVQRNPDPPGGSGAADPVSNVSLKFAAAPSTVRNADSNRVYVTLTKKFSVTGSAKVSGPDAAKYVFGWLQVCRPFQTKRCTYRQSGAAAGAGKDLIRDGTVALRKNQPALDTLAGSAWSSLTANGPNASVEFEDTPGAGFEKSFQRNGLSYDLTGVASANHFYTAFMVKGPDGVLRPLKAFFWDYNWCEDLPAGTDLSKEKKGTAVNRSGVSDCPGCSEGEYNKISKPPGDTCNTLGAFTWGNVSSEGPGDYKIGC